MSQSASFPSNLSDTPTTSATSTPSSPAWMLWTGRALTGLVGLALIASASMKLTADPELVAGFVELGFPEASLQPIGVVEIACALLLLIPQTTVLGAILVCSYLGGAVVVHVMKGDAFIVPILFGVAAWAGVFLRDARVRALLPLRRNG